MDFFGIGPIEVLLILLIAYLVLGPARMIDMARSLSSFVQEVRRTHQRVAGPAGSGGGIKEPST